MEMFQNLVVGGLSCLCSSTPPNDTSLSPCFFSNRPEADSMTHLLAQPMRGFSHLALPWRMSKSTLQAAVPAFPEEFAVFAGLKILTARCVSSAVNRHQLGV